MSRDGKVSVWNLQCELKEVIKESPRVMEQVLRLLRKGLGVVKLVVGLHHKCVGSN